MKIENITLAYGNKNILKDANITIDPGEFVFLIGGSGSGKTSFIKMLIGDLKPKSGKFFVNGNKDVYSYTEKELLAYRRSIGVVFQDYKLLRSKTVRENVAFAMEVSGYKDSYIGEKVPEILSRVGLLHKKESFVETLSGGEAQRISIARALIHDPEIIIGDEPTGNLDPHNAEEIIDLLLELGKQGKTIIIATHDDRIVNRLKKRVITFKDGRIVSDKEGGEYVL
ncbi:MAG: ATP-binding cassette domain-containing protein [Candidatus Gracilibacteria bacterium]|nr:ATP-binding cassette domain-containing protein [Candidatus Gracilibacteria bacterium]